MGAWIETLWIFKQAIFKQSHPVWVRGLKRILLKKEAAVVRLSHPVWVRGLKPAYSLETSRNA
ncbi:hypothetical protein DMB97_09105 [Campylobacter jejuni]|nr:hypothetical protein [Campylobacter jejuni]